MKLMKFGCLRDVFDYDGSLLTTDNLDADATLYLNSKLVNIIGYQRIINSFICYLMVLILI